MTTRDLHSVAPGSRQSEVTAEMDRIRHVPTALICDNPLLRSGVEQALSDTSFALQHASAASVSSLGAFAQKPVLFIIAVRENISRICEVAGQIKEQYPGSRIVALADHFEPSVMVHSYEAGVDGFCLSATDREVLIKSLELIMLGESALPFKLIDALVEHCRPTRGLQEQRSGKLSNLPASGAEKLSPREAEILGCLMHGAPNKVIARNLHISEATIKVHVKAILRKLGADNRTQAAMWATEHLSEKAAPSLKF